MPRTRVLIIDDSDLMRKLLRTIIEAEPDLEVVGEAADPLAARASIRLLKPDVMTLDIEMPQMGGLIFLEELMALRPTPVVMVSNLTQRGAPQAIRALELGAIDYIGKPQAGTAGLLLLQAELPAKLRIAAATNMNSWAATAALVTRPIRYEAASCPFKLIVIGSSTGGVEALRAIFLCLPQGLPPIVIAQHMPKIFTPSFAARLDSLSSLTVVEAADGMPLKPGCAYVAPGGLQTKIARGRQGLVARCADDTSGVGHKPSVDTLFVSAAETVQHAAIGVILTGMGRDGAAGLLRMRQAGARTFGQSADSCLVYGMPRAAWEAGAVEAEHAPSGLAHQIVNYCAGPVDRAQVNNSHLRAIF